MGGHAIGGAPQTRQCTLAAGRRRVFIDVLSAARAGPISGPPYGGCHTGRFHAVSELAPDRHLDTEQVVAGRCQGGCLVERLVHLGFGERGPDPRPLGLAEQVHQFAPGHTVGIDPFDRSADHPTRIGDRGIPAIRLAQELRLERQVDRSRGDIERKLLRVEVVLAHRDRERQRDAAAQPVMGAR